MIEKQEIRLTVMELATIFEVVMNVPVTSNTDTILIDRDENGDIRLYDSEKEIGIISCNPIKTPDYNGK